MKPTKFISFLIAILFPLVVTTFIAFYSYGSIGEWDKNREKFINHYFSNKNETTVQIENSIKFSASLYQKNISNLSYEDTEGNAIPLNNGVLSLPNFSIESYVILYEDNDFPTYIFYIYDIAYGTKDEPKVNPKNLYFVCVKTGEVDIDEALDTFKNDIKDLNSTGAATPTRELSGYLPVFDKNFDDVEKADKEHYVYTFTPNNTYTVKDDEGKEKIASTRFLDTRSVSFAIVEKLPDDETDYFRVWSKGSLTDIKSSTTANNDLNFHRLEGLLPGYNSSIAKAGYLRYIWPTILWQSAIALVISGTLSFLFISIWNIEETEDKKLKPKSIQKIKK